jgi:SlyX protein
MAFMVAPIMAIIYSHILASSQGSQAGYTAHRCRSKMRAMSTETRLESIEIKLAHLEHALNQISDVVARQQRELDAAQQRTKRLASQLEALETTGGASATAIEKPPHY